MPLRCLVLAVCLDLSCVWATSARQVSSNSASPQTYIREAREALAAGRAEEGERLLKLALQADPSSADAYLLLGLSEFRRGEVPASIENYKRAISLRPNSYSAHYNLALAYVRANKLNDARVQLEKATKLDPEQPDAFYNLGIVLLDVGDADAALSNLRRARDLNPRSPDVAFNLVRADLAAGRLQEAKQEARRSGAAFASNAEWNAAVGQLFLKQADATNAETYLMQAHRLRPEDSHVRNQLALAYLQGHEPDLVLKTITAPSTAEDYYVRASAYYVSHQFSEADRESEIAFRLAPDEPSIQLLRAHILQRSGQHEAALKLLQEIIRLKPGWDEPYYSAGVSYYFLGHYDQARRSLERALELNGNSVRTLFLLATTLAHDGAASDAGPYMERAIALQPSNARLHCHLGLILLQQNENERAEQCFRRAIGLKPDYGLPHYELGKLLMRSERFAEAARQLEMAIIQDPSLTSAYYQLSRVYSRLGQVQKSELVLAKFKTLQKQDNEAQTVREDVVKGAVSE